MKEPMGPNVRRLLFTFIARYAVPPESSNGLASAVNFFKGAATRSPAYVEVMRKARAGCEMALEAVKRAKGNPHGNDEEAIAGAILKAVEERKKQRRQGVQTK